MISLELHPSYLEKSLPMLGEYCAAFMAADGQEGLGPAWIARYAIPDDIITPIVERGWGRLVEVEVWDDKQVAAFLQLSSFEDEDPHMLVGGLVVCDEAPSTFTRYDAHTWMVSFAEIWPVETLTPEERLQLFRLGMLLSSDH